jgi:hypothetical protein
MVAALCFYQNPQNLKVWSDLFICQLKINHLIGKMKPGWNAGYVKSIPLCYKGIKKSQ